jgi:Secretion system C-terminal sorting domain/Beta-propeller repeat
MHYPEGYKHPTKFMKSEEMKKMETQQKQIRVETYRMDMNLVGANTNAIFTMEGKSDDYINYYNHNTLGVYSYNKIICHDIYPNIDWVIYKMGSNLKYDFVVRSGGNPTDIKLQTSFVENMNLNADGSLTLGNKMGEITEKTPISYQNEKPISTEFIVKGNTISFQIGKYNHNQNLIIDPTLLWATYYGGSDLEFGEYTCNVDATGNVYLAGYTQSSSNIALGGHQNTFAGIGDVFLAKFNTTGVRQWATYYGGSGTENGSCAVDAVGNVYLAGGTESNSNIASSGHQNTFGGRSDAFLVKFNASGVRQWATYYGGGDDDGGSSCAVDAIGNVYLAGSTKSTTNIASGGHQNIIAGNGDAFLVKFNTSGVRQWATYYGGSDGDDGSSCVVDATGNIYLAGDTKSNTNIASQGHQNQNTTIQSFYGDAFLVKFNTSGVRQWATYYGGNDDDSGTSCAVDATGNVYLTGNTNSNTNIASGGHQNTRMDSYDAFLVKFNTSGTRQWATYYGGNDIDLGFSCATDAAGNVYLVGDTYSKSNITYRGYQNTFGGGFDDAFLVKFDASGTRQWATYYGGSEDDIGSSCAIDAAGNVYIAGYTKSSSNIAYAGHKNTYAGNTDAFLAKLTSLATATGDFETINNLNILPNPTHDKLTINLKNTEGSIKVKVTITDIAGRTLIQQTIQTPQADINVSSLINGLYLITVETTDGRRGVQKFVKN